MKGRGKMPTETFLNLDPAKQSRIVQACLHEFGAHPLSEAHVAPIVKESKIARGSFYKYFEDLTDAYQYIYGIVLREIHKGIRPPDRGKVQVSDYLAQVTNFLDQSQQSGYYDLIRQHLLHNEERIAPRPQAVPMELSPQNWAVRILVHTTIKECVRDPKDQTTKLDRLAAVLTKLLAE